MHVPSTLSATFTLTSRSNPAQQTATRAATGVNDGSSVFTPATLDAPPAAPDSSNGDTLISRLNFTRRSEDTHHGDRPRHGDKIDHKHIEKELRRTLKPTIKAIKHETKQLLQEIGADEDEHKAVRALYKDFRHTIRDEIKLAKRSNLDDLKDTAPRIEQAFTAFISGLRDIFTPSGDSETRVTEGPAVVTRGDSLTPTTPPLTLSESTLVGATAGNIVTQPEQPLVTATPPTKPDVAQPPLTLSGSTLVGVNAGNVGTQPENLSDTLSRPSESPKPPSRLDQFISAIKNIFEEGLGSLTDRIASIQTDQPARHHGEHRHGHGTHNANRGPRQSNVTSAYTFNIRVNVGIRFDIAA